MKKILLMTIWHVKNFGAELQTYATVKTLQEMGHEVRVIDYRLFYKPKHSSLIGYFIDFAHYIAPENLKFINFWNKYIPKTKHYKCYHDLKKEIPNADLYLVGSDQVWNPKITKEKVLTYFLDFIQEEKQMASYASSFGVDDWQASEDLTQKVQKRLSLFKSVSCREKQGVEILRKHFNITATHVLDPSLLRENYKELTGNVKIKPILTYYQLSDSPRLMHFAQQMAIKLGLQFKNINKKQFLTPSFIWNRCSLQQWIRAIAESSFVITHSFHGLAMCLIYHRPFIVVYENGDRISRITNLLDIVGLRDRLFTSIREAEESNIGLINIDWSKVDSSLQKQRTISLDYLHRITQI